MQKRPWEISDLLALRDGELSDANASVEDSAAVEQLRKIRQLQTQLNVLPDVPVDEAVWNRNMIARARPSPWLRFPLATAASVFFASVVGIYLMFGGSDPGPQMQPGSGAVDYAGSSLVDPKGVRLAALMNQSQDLERRLREQGVAPMMLTPAAAQRQTTQDRAISPTERLLNYRLADVDAQIARLYEADDIDLAKSQALWTQRVKLLDSVVAVRGGYDPRIFEDSRSM